LEEGLEATGVALLLLLLLQVSLAPGFAFPRTRDSSYGLFRVVS
jgi:hypothetical protein